MKYAIIDIETTGGFNSSPQRITEIAIYVHDGHKIIEEYTTLVNPERSIPPFITRLTGIDDAMVADAPLFETIAPKVDEITQDAVFVAHSVNFDYSVIREEFKRIGVDYTRERMCTVRMSRKILPGHASYSLGKLCAALDISLHDRHRASGDARATVYLFELLLKTNRAAIEEGLHLYKRSYGNIPSLLSKEVYRNLPEATGVYYFLNRKGQVIYVGKALNIKKRVAAHFNDKSSKELLLLRKIADIQYEITHDELVALVLESNEIKRLQPMFNKSQRKKKEQVGFAYYYNQVGIIQFYEVKNKPKFNPVISFYSTKEAAAFFGYMSEYHGLCPKYCNHQHVTDACFNLEQKTCLVACGGKESVLSYNQRVLEAVEMYKPFKGHLIIRGKCVLPEKETVVLIENGVYKGYAVVPEGREEDVTLIETNLVVQPDHRDIHRILRAWLKKHPDISPTFYDPQPKALQLEFY